MESKTAVQGVRRVAYRRDIAEGRKPDISKPGTEFRIDGLHNIVFLLMIVGGIKIGSEKCAKPSLKNVEKCVDKF